MKVIKKYDENFSIIFYFTRFETCSMNEPGCKICRLFVSEKSNNKEKIVRK